MERRSPKRGNGLSDLADEIINFALVIRGPFQSFLDAVEYVEGLDKTRIIYKTKSVGSLWIVKEGEEVKRNE